jgi:hypothetical protein
MTGTVPCIVASKACSDDLSGHHPPPERFADVI